MSTWLAPIPDIKFDALFDGRLEKYGIREHIMAEASERERYLVGRDGFLEVRREQNGTCTFTRRGCIPWSIYDAIAEEFEVEIVTEHDHRFWGFATEKEWNDWNEKLHKDHEEKLYTEIIKYIRDEPNDLEPGTDGMKQAEIAKALVEDDQSLATLEKRDVLLEAVQTLSRRDNSFKFTLTEREQAMVELMVARTDDLRKA